MIFNTVFQLLLHSKNRSLFYVWVFKNSLYKKNFKKLFFVKYYEINYKKQKQIIFNLIKRNKIKMINILLSKYLIWKKLNYDYKK